MPMLDGVEHEIPTTEICEDCHKIIHIIYLQEFTKGSDAEKLRAIDKLVEKDIKLEQIIKFNESICIDMGLPMPPYLKRPPHKAND